MRSAVSPIAAKTASTAICASPPVGTGPRRPEASGSPRRISSTVTTRPVGRLRSTARGRVSQLKATPSVDGPLGTPRGSPASRRRSGGRARSPRRRVGAAPGRRPWRCCHRRSRRTGGRGGRPSLHATASRNPRPGRTRSVAGDAQGTLAPGAGGDEHRGVDSVEIVEGEVPAQLDPGAELESPWRRGGRSPRRRPRRAAGTRGCRSAACRPADHDARTRSPRARTGAGSRRRTARPGPIRPPRRCAGCCGGGGGAVGGGGVAQPALDGADRHRTLGRDHGEIAVLLARVGAHPSGDAGERVALGEAVERLGRRCPGRCGRGTPGWPPRRDSRRRTGRCRSCSTGRTLRHAPVFSAVAVEASETGISG